MEQSLEHDCENDDNYLFKLSQLIGKSDDELDSFLINEGYIDCELD